MNRPSHKTEGVNRTKTVRVYPFVFTVEVPCKEVRTPLTSITFSEERDEETCYGYCDDYQPHAARRIYDQENDMLYDFRWDKVGNLGQISLAGKEALFKSGRFLFWTEDNRLHTAVDEKHYSYYVYDHSGERRVKLTGESEWLDANANLMLTGTLLYKPTLYPSPYLVLSMNEYTKHYYAGAERVAACLGGGGLDIVLGNNLTEPTAPAYSTPWGGLFDNGSTDPEEVIVNDTIVMLQEASTKLFEQSGWQVNQRELNGNELNCIAEIDAYHAELHRTIAGIPDRMETGITLDFDKFHDKVRDLKKIQHDEREYVYYYHGDHLGSASWITNHNGDAVQHLQYLPYGEPYVDKRTSGYSERFRFTGKERDEETGYGYFGARYMDHELMTMWLSVDLMADKYPSISPYAYCAWNPVKLVDPDGREIDVSGLSEAMQQRLVKCLGYITGLNLTVKDGLLVSTGKTSRKYIFSKSAQSDLLAAIEDKEKKVFVSMNTIDEDKGGTEKGVRKIKLGSFHQEKFDKETNGLGMAFLHELGHAYFDDNDPSEHNNFIYYENEDRIEYSGPTGEAVDRVNRYRTEMKYATRETYESCSGLPGAGKRFNGKVPFRFSRRFLWIIPYSEIKFLPLK